MEVKAEIVERSYREVNVDMSDLFKRLQQKLVHDAKVPYGSYINSNGHWEDWDSCRGQGSGITTVHRQATPEEAAEWNAIALLRAKHAHS